MFGCSSQEKGVVCHSGRVCSLKFTVETIRHILLYAARSVCLSVPVAHPHAESPHSLSLSHSNHCTTFTPVPKHIQFLNCEVSINTELLNCSKCLSCFTICLVCVAVQFCTAKRSPNSDVFWRQLGSTEGRMSVVSTGVLVLK